MSKFVEDRFNQYVVVNYLAAPATWAGKIKLDCSKCEVMILEVDREWRNQGIGTSLLKHGEKILKERGCTTANVYVGRIDHCANPPYEFYKKAGYKHDFWRNLGLNPKPYMYADLT